MVKIYLMREAGTTKIHGIFWARTLGALWDAIDEMADPSFFEVSEITDPGGIWHNNSLSDTEASDQDGEEDGFFLTPLDDSGEFLIEQIFHQAAYEWRRMPTVDQCDNRMRRALRRLENDREEER